jgi:hypothetical protein
VDAEIEGHFIIDHMEEQSAVLAVLLLNSIYFPVPGLDV